MNSKFIPDHDEAIKPQKFKPLVDEIKPIKF